ncbi:MAG: hypothetical protein WCD89_23575 [Anaerocolumna sp.]
MSCYYWKLMGAIADSLNLQPVVNQRFYEIASRGVIVLISK